MDAGFQVVNDDGIVVIDQNYFNLEHTATIKIDHYYTASEVYGANPGWIPVSFTIQDSPGHLIAFGNFFSTTADGFRRPDGSAALIGKLSSNGNVTYTLALPYGYVSNQISSTSTGSARFECDIYVFTKPVPIAGGGVGLQVFKEDGSLAYDSRKKYLKPLRFITRQDNTFEIPADQLIEWETTNRYAIIQGAPRISAQGWSPRNALSMDVFRQLYGGNGLCAFYYGIHFLGYTNDAVNPGVSWIQGSGGSHMLLNVFDYT